MSDNLSPDEQRVVQAFRKLNSSKKEQVLSSFEAFVSWVKTMYDIWVKVQNTIRYIWDALTSSNSGGSLWDIFNW